MFNVAMTTFDPFKYRQARDIRNTLSREFLKIIKTGSKKNLHHLCSKFLSENSIPIYLDYITVRCEAYGKVLNKITDEKITDPYLQAFILWDLGLFFEFHDQLEPLWMKANGMQKKALQGLIRAAGSFVLLDAVKKGAAFKMAKKAIKALQAYGKELPVIPGKKEAVAEIIKKVQKRVR